MRSKNQYAAQPPPREGELYRRVLIGSRTFEVFYGYYEDFEREKHEPMPLYPDLLREPVYTEDGMLIVTGMQDSCRDHRCFP